MKKWLFALAFILLGSPAVFACEQCVPKGWLDPNGGGPYGSALCWTADDGGWSYCWGGDRWCTGGDPENACPIPTKNKCKNEFDPDCLPILEPVASAPEVSGPALEDECTLDVAGRCGPSPGGDVFAL